MENLGELIAKVPELTPGLILGALAGVAYGMWHDHQAGKGAVEGGSAWGAGGIGMLLGGVAWLWFVVE